MSWLGKKDVFELELDKLYRDLETARYEHGKAQNKRDFREVARWETRQDKIRDRISELKILRNNAKAEQAQIANEKQRQLEDGNQSFPGAAAYQDWATQPIGDVDEPFANPEAEAIRQGLLLCGHPPNKAREIVIWNGPEGAKKILGNSVVDQLRGYGFSFEQLKEVFQKGGLTELLRLLEQIKRSRQNFLPQ